MTQIKIYTDENSRNLEMRVNGFIKKNYVDVVDIKFQEFWNNHLDKPSSTAVVMYKEQKKKSLVGDNNESHSKSISNSCSGSWSIFD